MFIKLKNKISGEIIEVSEKLYKDILSDKQRSSKLELFVGELDVKDIISEENTVVEDILVENTIKETKKSKRSKNIIK